MTPWRSYTLLAALGVLLGSLALAAPASGMMSFTRSWGWGVSDGGSSWETCAASCRAGLAGGGAGQLNNPYGVVADGSGKVFVADRDNNRIDEFSSTGAFARAWGWGVKDLMGQFETCTSTCEPGMASPGGFAGPDGIATDGNGNLFVADASNNRIDEFTSGGAFERAWGWNVSGPPPPAAFEICTSNCFQGTIGDQAGQFNYALGIAASRSGQVYVNDYSNQRIEQFTTTGEFTRAWGWGVSDGASHFETCTTTCRHGVLGDGAGQFNYPWDLAADGSGNVYVATNNNNRIDEFSSGGDLVRAWGFGVSDNAGNLETCTSACHSGIASSKAGALYFPYGVAVDPSGNVFVGDYYNYRIDEFSPSGGFIRAWGWGVTDGAYHFETCTTTCRMGLPGAHAGQLDTPWSVTADGHGNIYVADKSEQRIDQFTVIPPQTTITQGPRARTNHKKSAFSFASSHSGSTFVCRIDARPAFSCAAPLTIGPLADGTHTFRVTARDSEGDPDPTPAIRTFTVDTRPPDTTITSGPANRAKTHNRTPTFKFKSSEHGSTFACKLDKATFKRCRSGKALKKLSFGKHTLRVRATDAAGNTDLTPAKRRFKVVR